MLIIIEESEKKKKQKKRLPRERSAMRFTSGDETTRKLILSRKRAIEKNRIVDFARSRRRDRKFTGQVRSVGGEKKRRRV